MKLKWRPWKYHKEEAIINGGIIRMGKRIALNKKELEIILIIMGENALKDITVIDEGFSIDENIVEEMLKKGFFEETDDGRKMNPFVHFVIWNVCNADCELHSWGPGSSICNIYFKSDVMILLSKKNDAEEYVFYFVPYIPQAIGGFSYFYSELTDSMTGENGSEINELAAESDIKQIDDLLRALRENGVNGSTDEQLKFSLRGDVFGESALFGALLKTDDGWMFAQVEDRFVTYSQVNGFGMLKKISEWIIATHGSCISWGKKNE